MLLVLLRIYMGVIAMKGAQGFRTGCSWILYLEHITWSALLFLWAWEKWDREINRKR